MSDTLNFNDLRSEFPAMSPAELYDVACKRLDIAATWETSSSMACSNWMDMFANAPFSYASH